jgi:hypothetical protein
MSEPVRCEQVVLGWSANTLLGGDGFGPIFASAGWPLPPGDRDAGLGSRARFLDQSSATLIGDGSQPPRCLSYEPAEGGTLLISKSYAAGANRPGQYVVHALLDPTRTLRSRDLFACAESGLLLDEQPSGDADPSWPAALVPRQLPGAETALDRTEQVALAVLLGCLTDRRTMIIHSSDQERAAQLVRRVVDVLPDSLARELALSTFATDPEQSGLGICVAVPPFSRVSGGVDLDLDAALPAPDSATTQMVAELTAAGPKPGLDQVGSVVELWSWARLQTGRLEDLGADDIHRLLTGPLWRTFLDRVDQSGPTSLLLDALVDAEIRPVLAERLANPDAELAKQLARAVARPTGLDRRGQGALQDQLVSVLGSGAFARSVLPGVHQLAKRGQPVVVASTALADLVAASIGRRGSAPLTAFDWYADTSTWSVVTGQRLIDWLTRGGPPADSLQGAVRREPAVFAAALDDLIVEQRFSTRVLVDRMGDWPDEDLESLVTALLATRRTTRLFILDVLGARRVQLARPLLRRYWPDIARHAELSPALTEMLEVAEDPKRTRWPWTRP